jgi:NADH-quinone oxidoreductase subunit J
MELFFYLFASIIVISSVLVVISSNPIYSVLWLIFTFCNASGLMILLGAEFLAMMLIVIYVGAIAVLFLFVVMMLDIRLAEPKSCFRKNLFVGSIIAAVMLFDLALVILLATKSIGIDVNPAFIIPDSLSNSHAIGQLLYTEFILPFQTAGIILFVAMVSCIVLTLRRTEGVKRQNVRDQLQRNKDNSLSIVKTANVKGIEGISYE